MTTRAVRVLVALVCAGGIAGMIVGSIADNNAVAMTFGLVTAAAALCLIVATAVTKPSVASTDVDVDIEAAGADVEARIARLVEQGADEAELRALVRASVQVGRSGR